MTLMTLNPGYGIGISPKQRHKRHQRHYRHARTVPGSGGHPQKCVCGYPNAMLAKHVCHQNDDKQTRYPHKFVYDLQSESLLIHPKILTRKNESVLIHTAIRARVAERRKIARLRAFPVQNSLRSRHKQHGCFPEKSA